MKLNSAELTKIGPTLTKLTFSENIYLKCYTKNQLFFVSNTFLAFKIFFEPVYFLPQIHISNFHSLTWNSITNIAILTGIKYVRAPTRNLELPLVMKVIYFGVLTSGRVRPMWYKGQKSPLIYREFQSLQYPRPRTARISGQKSKLLK